MKKWERLEPTKVQKVGFRTVVTKTFRMPNGEVAEFGTVWPEGHQCVAIIALTKSNQVVVARMFRVGPELIMEELPGGFVDDGESVEEAGERELLEETGYKAGKIEYLGKNHKDTYANAVWHTVLATDCEFVGKPTHGEAEEHTEVHLISIDQLIENGKNDLMTDAVSILIAYDRLQAVKN